MTLALEEARKAETQGEIPVGCVVVAHEKKVERQKNAALKDKRLLKPVSCHLYPIRVTHSKGRVGLEYHRWDICHCARVKGKKEKIKLYEFLREPLIRRFGEAWYDELVLTAKEWEKQCAQK